MNRKLFFTLLLFISLVAVAFVLPPSSPMYRHVVCFKFKAGTSQVAIAQHMQSFAALKDSIPFIKGYSAGPTFKVSYEKTADYDVMHIVSFTTEADMEKYFHHPAHRRFIEEHKANWEQVIVINSREN